MTIWKAGMLAVCINNKPLPNKLGGFWQGNNLPPIGSVCRVLQLGRSLTYSGRDGGETSLILESGHHGVARRFRPAVQDNQSADAEFTALIKGKVKA